MPTMHNAGSALTDMVAAVQDSAAGPERQAAVRFWAGLYAASPRRPDENPVAWSRRRCAKKK